MAVDEITNHIQLAKARLIQQYKGDEDVEALVEMGTNDKQDQETAFQQMNNERGLDSSVGAQLDGIGKIVGLERLPGESDDAYRVRIKAQIGINLSQGEPERMIETFKILTGAPFVYFQKLDSGEVALSSSINFGTQEEVDDIIQIMESVAPAGVRVAFIGVFDADLSDTFAFAGNLPGKGFGSVSDVNKGGKFATLLVRGGEFAFDGETNAEGFGTIHDPLVSGRFQS